MEELKPDQHDEVIAKLDKNIIVEQELKQQLSSPEHTVHLRQIKLQKNRIHLQILHKI